VLRTLSTIDQYSPKRRIIVGRLRARDVVVSISVRAWAFAEDLITVREVFPRKAAIGYQCPGTGLGLPGAGHRRGAWRPHLGREGRQGDAVFPADHGIEYGSGSSHCSDFDVFELRKSRLRLL
jgi:hypothetical protein